MRLTKKQIKAIRIVKGYDTHAKKLELSRLELDSLQKFISEIFEDMFWEELPDFTADLTYDEYERYKAVQVQKIMYAVINGKNIG